MWESWNNEFTGIVCFRLCGNTVTINHKCPTSMKNIPAKLDSVKVSDLGINKNTGFNNGVSQKLRRGNQSNVPVQPTLRRLSEAHPFFVITQPEDDSYSLKCHRCQFLLNLRHSLVRFIVCFSILDAHVVSIINWQLLSSNKFPACLNVLKQLWFINLTVRQQIT